MDLAYLHEVVIDIELKRKELEAQGLNRQKIMKLLNSQYRNFSKKKAFTCRCCEEPVSMNLTKEDGRPFFFRHFDGNKCSYSENSKIYEKQNTDPESKRKKDIGLTVFREILEGQLKPFGVKVERGYMYRKKLSFIPDLILKFPSSEQLWALDYFTSMVTMRSYVSYLEKRMNTYKEEGFKVFSFIDDSWLAIDQDTDKGTLLLAEKHVTKKDKEDLRWDEFLSKELTKEMKRFLQEEMRTTNSAIDTRSISYVNVDDRTCKVIRFLESTQNERNLTFYELSKPTISLERALSLNIEQDDFLLYGEDEDQLRQDFKNGLMERWEQAELEKKEKEKEEAQKVQHQENQNKVLQDPIQMVKKSSDDQLEGEAYKEYGIWKWRKIDHSPPQKLEPVYVPIKDIIEKERREKFDEKVLFYPISGENYINGDGSEWRTLIIKCVEKEVGKKGNRLTISISKLLKDLKESNITFNQKDTLVECSIKIFLDFYQKEIKKDLKIEMNIMYVD